MDTTQERIFAYCGNDETIPEPRTLGSGTQFFPASTVGSSSWHGTITTWHGDRLGIYTVVSRWRARYSYRYAIIATIDGIDYYGQTDGPGMCVSLKAYTQQRNTA